LSSIDATTNRFATIRPPQQHEIRKWSEWEWETTAGERRWSKSERELQRDGIGGGGRVRVRTAERDRWR
jgi:hypothetical protein